MTCYWRWRFKPVVHKHRELHGFMIHTIGQKQKEVASRKQASPLGWPIPVQYALTAYWGDVYKQRKVCKSSRNATQHHTEVIMEYSAHKPKFGNAGSSGWRCTRTPRSSFEGAKNVSYRVASQLVMQCPSTITYKWRSLMFGALTSWGHSKSPMIASTSLSSLTTCQNGWKPYHVELLMPGMQGRCFMK